MPYKYSDSSTVYGDNNQAFSTPEQAFASGVKTDWSNIQTIQGSAPTLQTAPNPATPVPSGGLGANTSFPSTPAPSNPTPFVGSLNDSLKYFQDLYTKQQTDLETAQKERNDLKTLLGEGYDKQNTVDDLQKETEADLGLPKAYEDLNNLNTLMAERTAQYNNLYAQTETKGITSGISAPFWQGEVAAQQRQAAVELGSLGVRQAAAVNNVELMQSRANQTVKAATEDIENQIQKTLKFLELNADDMSDSERRQANALKLNLEFQQQTLDQQKQDMKDGLMAGITTPYYNKGGTIIRMADGKAYITPEEFFKDAGVTNWEDVSRRNLVTDYTQAVTPVASTNNKKSNINDNTDLKPTADTSGEIKSWVIANKRANSDVPYYDLWGQLADELKKQGLNPDNYDKVFWEILHPEGIVGYEAEQKKKKGTSTNTGGGINFDDL